MRVRVNVVGKQISGDFLWAIRKFKKKKKQNSEKCMKFLFESIVRCILFNVWRLFHRNVDRDCASNASFA